MVLLWPLAGEELKRIQREALDPVVVTQLRKVQHLKPLGRGRWRRPPRSQQAIEEAEARDAVLRRVEPLRWSVKRGEALRMVMEAKVSRKKIALEVDCSSDTTLNFGDAVRVVLPGLGEDTISTCLSACVRPGATSQVGFREAQAADASFEERRLAKDLASWGRRAYDFVALSCAPIEDAILRRSAWTVYRANVMDAFPGPKVHYGQHLMLGQPEATEVPTKELLLSCEPPSRCGGVGAAYQLMGRFYGFGHAPTGRRSWNTVFTLVPVDDDLHLGDEVDVMRGGRIVPLAPFSYLHGFYA